MKAKLTTPDIDLKLVMDQSIYVRKAIESLTWEGILGAILCSLVILIFLGEWRMTMIAVMTIPVAVLGAIAGLSAAGQTVNVMTLAGLALAIGPLVDSAIICLENTHRHLGLGAAPRQAAFLGASEVAMPELVASCCTLLVLAPLAFMPGMGKFLFRPDVPRRCLRHDYRLYPIADLRAQPLRQLDEAPRPQTIRNGRLRLRASQCA